MTQLTQEEVRDEILSLYEEKEESLQKFSSEIEKIENEGIESFEKKVISIKNKLVQDTAVSDDELETKYLEEVELARKVVFQEVEEKIKTLVRGAESNMV
jgi:hypothetical protein